MVIVFCAVFISNIRNGISHKADHQNVPFGESTIKIIGIIPKSASLNSVLISIIEIGIAIIIIKLKMPFNAFVIFMFASFALWSCETNQLIIKKTIPNTQNFAIPSASAAGRASEKNR